MTEDLANREIISSLFCSYTVQMDTNTNTNTNTNNDCDWNDDDDDTGSYGSCPCTGKHFYSGVLLLSSNPQDPWEWQVQYYRDYDADPSGQTTIPVPDTCPERWRSVYAMCTRRVREIRDQLAHNLHIQLGLMEVHDASDTVPFEDRINYDDDSDMMQEIAAMYVFMNYSEQVKADEECSSLPHENAMGLVLLAAMASNLYTVTDVGTLKEHMRLHIMEPWEEVLRFRDIRQSMSNGNV